MLPGSLPSFASVDLPFERTTFAIPHTLSPFVVHPCLVPIPSSLFPVLYSLSPFRSPSYKGVFDALKDASASLPPLASLDVMVDGRVPIGEGEGEGDGIGGS